MRPYYEQDGITIYHGECEDVMADWRRESVDIIVTSPQYNMGLVPGGNGRGMYKPGANNKGGRFRAGYSVAGDDAMPQDEYDDWQRACLDLFFDSVRLAVFYNHRPRVEHGHLRMPMSMDFNPPLRQIIIWDRGTGIDVNRRHFCTRQEWVMLFAKPDFQLRDHAASGLGDVWRFGPETGVPDHPAPFPVSLPLRCIDATDDVGSVCDPFMGSGSTLIAAMQMGIRGIGIEKNERFCELAAKRLGQGAFDLRAS